MAPLLGQSRVVDNQPGILAPDLPVGFGEQRQLQRRLIPDAAANEVMQPIVADLVISRSHRLHTLAITWANQTRYVDRAHPAPRLVSQSRSKRREPRVQFTPPIR